MSAGAAPRKSGRTRPTATFRPSLVALLTTPFLRAAVGVFAIGAIQRYHVRGFPPETAAVVAGWAKVGVAAMVAWDVAWALVVRATTSLSVYGDHLAYGRGLAGRRVTKVWSREIVGVEVVRTVAGRLLGYGTVTVETRGTERVVALRFADAAEVADAIDGSRRVVE